MNKKKDLPDNNMFVNAKTMILASIGRLPTALVMILLCSAAMAAVTAMILIFSQEPKAAHVFMQQRLEASGTAPVVTTKDMQGTWILQTPSYAMSFTLIGDRFEWIVLFGDIQEVRYFARGNFRTDGDVMILGIRPDLGSPFDETKPWLKYMPIGMRDINFKWSVEGGKFVWNIPASEQKKIIAEVSRIFNEQPDGRFEWSRSE